MASPKSFFYSIDDNVVLILLAFIVALYASMLCAKLPNYIVALFRNDIFRVLFLSLLLIYSFKSKPEIALIIAIIFVITLEFLNYREAIENYDTAKVLKLANEKLKKERGSCLQRKYRVRGYTEQKKY
jgi:hypothetical protein